MYKTTKIMIAISSIFCLALFGGGVFARADNEFPEAVVGASYEPMGSNTFEASWLIGHRVETTTFADLGQIDSLVIDKANGRVALVVLSNVPGLGNERLAMPFSSITDIGAGTAEFNPGDMTIEVAPPSSDFATWPFADDIIYTLTRYPSYSEYYGLPSAIEAAWMNDIYRHYGQIPYWTENGEKAPGASDLVRSDKLIGVEVQLPDGKAAGQINDLVIDSSDGRIPLLVLSDVPERETSLVAVPFAELSIRGENVFVLNTDREKLALAPSFSASEDLNNPRYAGDVYRYFGLQPYWSEQREMESIHAKPESMGLEPNTLEWYQMYGY